MADRQVQAQAKDPAENKMQSHFPADTPNLYGWFSCSLSHLVLGVNTHPLDFQGIPHQLQEVEEKKTPRTLTSGNGFFPSLFTL